MSRCRGNRASAQHRSCHESDRRQLRESRLWKALAGSGEDKDDGRALMSGRQESRRTIHAAMCHTATPREPLIKNCGDCPVVAAGKAGRRHGNRRARLALVSRRVPQAREDHRRLHDGEPRVPRGERGEEEDEAPVEQPPRPRQILERPVRLRVVRPEEHQQRQPKHTGIRLDKAPPHLAVRDSSRVPNDECLPQRECAVESERNVRHFRFTRRIVSQSVVQLFAEENPDQMREDESSHANDGRKNSVDREAKIEQMPPPAPCQ
mmetsp:Transcript_21238/g.55421  ORF Transcript_21238/g.55421 Transcript_21238/m.55421 type:complete len:264 (-) Transcript_21238:40-831(-)